VPRALHPFPTRRSSDLFGLHSFIDDAGIDMHWLDWCCDGPQPDTPGLTPDTWINSRYAAHQRTRGTRWPAFSRIGGHFVPGASRSEEHTSELQSQSNLV